MKETNSERTIKERCDRFCGNIGKMIALRALFRCLSYNGEKKIPAHVKNYGHNELIKFCIGSLKRAVLQLKIEIARASNCMTCRE